MTSEKATPHTTAELLEMICQQACRLLDVNEGDAICLR